MSESVVRSHELSVSWRRLTRKQAQQQPGTCALGQLTISECELSRNDPPYLSHVWDAGIPYPNIRSADSVSRIFKTSQDLRPRFDRFGFL